MKTILDHLLHFTLVEQPVMLLKGLGALEYVTSGLTLVGLIIIALLFAWKFKLDQEASILAGRDPQSLSILAQRYHIPPTGMPPEQLHLALMAEIKNRRDQQRLYTYWGMGATLLVFLLALYSIISTSSTQTLTPDLSKPLVGDTTWGSDTRDVLLAGVVKTNGYPLTIKAKKLIAQNASIDGTVLLGDAPQTPDPKSQQPQALPGKPGAPGQNGETGTTGTPGQAIGKVEITAQEVQGTLTVNTSGQIGGTGGQGGDGGRGGTGGQGTSSRAGSFGDCAAGPGRGFTGGKGGTGGTGGQAGKGGAGGDIIITTNKLKGTLTLLAKGGTPGLPGNPGQPGLGGDGGLEGAIEGKCGSAGRNGFTGDRGDFGKKGQSNETGSHGTIAVEYNGIKQRSLTGSLTISRF